MQGISTRVVATELNFRARSNVWYGKRRSAVTNVTRSFSILQTFLKAWTTIQPRARNAPFLQLRSARRPGCSTIRANSRRSARCVTFIFVTFVWKSVGRTAVGRTARSPTRKNFQAQPARTGSVRFFRRSELARKYQGVSRTEV